MNDESNTLGFGPGTDFVEPAEGDNSSNMTYWDPDDDDQDNPEGHAAEEIEDDGQPEDEDPETAEAQAEDETEDGEDDEDSEAQAKPDLIELPDGTKVERDEVVKGYLRQSDYTAKTTAVAEQRKRLEAETTRINGITEAFIDHLAQMIPPAPDQALAYRDPNAYTRAKAAHDAAVAQVQQLVQVGEQAKQVQQGVQQAEMQQVIAEENRKLAERFPETTNQKGRQEFFGQVAETAQALGFSMDELQSATDHRLFTLAHYAALGMKAEQAKGKAKEKAAKAPPATPQKPSASKRQGAARNREAMKRLAKTGSFEDALQVDFD
jgi:hypothetical protein